VSAAARFIRARDVFEVRGPVPDGEGSQMAGGTVRTWMRRIAGASALGYVVVAVVAAGQGQWWPLYGVAVAALIAAAPAWVAVLLFGIRRERRTATVFGAVLIPVTALASFVAAISDLPSRPMTLPEDLGTVAVYLVGAGAITWCLWLVRPRRPAE
jgi:drug/metabolite transporter (DMT)-like permease